MRVCVCRSGVARAVAATAAVTQTRFSAPTSRRGRRVAVISIEAASVVVCWTSLIFTGCDVCVAVAAAVGCCGRGAVAPHPIFIWLFGVHLFSAVAGCVVGCPSAAVRLPFVGVSFLSLSHRRRDSRVRRARDIHHPTLWHVRTRSSRPSIATTVTL